MNQNFLPPAGNKPLSAEALLAFINHPKEAKAWLEDYAKATEEREGHLARMVEIEATANADREAAEQMMSNCGFTAAGMIDAADADASTRQARAAEEAKRTRDEAAVVLAEARGVSALLDDRAETITARETAVMSLRTAAEALKDDAQADREAARVDRADAAQRLRSVMSAAKAAGA